jgi:hypothetical protein
LSFYMVYPHRKPHFHVTASGIRGTHLPRWLEPGEGPEKGAERLSEQELMVRCDGRNRPVQGLEWKMERAEGWMTAGVFENNGKC